MRWIDVCPRMRSCLLVLACSLALKAVRAQNQPSVSSGNDGLTETVRELQQQVQDLRKTVQQVQSQAEQYHQETIDLRRQLDAERSATPAVQPGSSVVAQTQDPISSAKDKDDEQRTARLEEEYQLLSGEIQEQYQSKVESWSRYKIRLSGIVLFNLFSNVGTVDNADIPNLAYPSAPGASGGSFGGTLRQSQIGLAVTGPQFLGAHTSADLRFDFGGGFSQVPNGVNYGLAWLRTGTARLDWTNTSLVLGQDALFFSPLSPTSFASQSIPALAYAGNLWAWTPQVRVEHRFPISDNSSFLVQVGIVDNLDGELPTPTSASFPYRTPQAGEASRQPAYATRFAWTRQVFGQPLSIAAAGYYGRQNYGFNQNIDGWAGMTDVNLPLHRMFSLSGKFYRGKAVGGLSGALGNSIVSSGPVGQAGTQVHGINSAGGWAQFKFQPRSTLEFNATFGEDSPFAADLLYFPGGGANPIYITRNQGTIANVIYRPRTDLLFSAEYHYLKTFWLSTPTTTASQFNLIMGVLF